MSLHPLVGHEAVRGVLAGAHARGLLPAAILLHGPTGVGKQRLALWLAQLVVCEAPTPAGPCDACRTCRMARGLEHPDVHWYMPVERPRASGDRLTDALEDARMGVLAERREEPLYTRYSDDVRGLYLGVVQNVRRRAHLRPSMAAGQLFLIGDAESLIPQESSPEAANALLKLLEEPPGPTRFVLTTAEPGWLPATIRSRTVPFHVGPLPVSSVADFLVEHAGVDAERAGWAAGLSRGSIGRALGFLPDGGQGGALEVQRRRAFTIVRAAIAGGLGDGYGVALGFPPARARTLLDVFVFVDEWLRDLAALVTGADALVVHTDALAELRDLVERGALEAPDLADAIGAVERARELARGNVNPQLVVAALIRELGATLRSVRMAGAPR